MFREHARRWPSWTAVCATRDASRDSPRADAPAAILDGHVHDERRITGCVVSTRAGGRPGRPCAELGYGYYMFGSVDEGATYKSLTTHTAVQDGHLRVGR